MAWFNFIKEAGYFAPENNPEPVRVKDGFQIPYWDVLEYLEKLSIQIKIGEDIELTDDLLEVITNVSANPKDNYRTWYMFIKILSNIPNEKIPLEILHFIPVWLSGKFDTMLQSSELCDKLLPKFLNDEPTEDDIKKAELILHYLFQVEKADIKDIWEKEGKSYISRVYLHFLSSKLKKGNLIPKIAKYCSSNIILELGRTLKFLLLDYPNGVNTLLNDREKEYEIKINIEKENLLISSKMRNDEIVSEAIILENWEEKNEEELRQELISILKQQGINYTPTDNNDDTFHRLNYALNDDLTSAFGFKSIRKLGDRYSDNEKLLYVLLLIFRDLLDEKAGLFPEETVSLLRTFCFDKKYDLPVYKRISLYVVCENWETTKSLFWELTKDNDALHLFSNYKYQKELYDLLNRTQEALEEDEKEILTRIIYKGEQEDVNTEDENHKEYWQLRWYAALRDIAPFKEKYLTLSESLKVTHAHYENLGEIKYRSGSISPISEEDLLEKSNQEIVEYIKTFRPKDRWEGPDVSGLAETFGNAVKTQPEKFANEIDLYVDIGYIYSYHMLNAFGEAWKKQKRFNWEKVLRYCLQTLESEKFYSGELKVENDTWNATSEWVEGSIAHLITDGLRDDNNAFDITLLPLAKQIFQIIVNKLQRVDNIKETNMDYPTYSLNSLAGKSLRALFDYSLHRARNLYKYENKGKWEPEIKALFENALGKGIIDAFILEGEYFEQFYFLDKDWIVEQIKQHYTSEKREWIAFMSGLVFGNPPSTKELYLLFYPHYERAIDNNFNQKSFHDNGLARHLTAFYFWNFETLASEKLLFKFLNNSTPDKVNDLISFIWQQEQYYKNLSEIEKQEFQQIILELWKYLADKYENASVEEEQNNLTHLTHWIIFVPELNDTYTQLIVKSCKYLDKVYLTYTLLEKLVILKDKGNPNTAAKSIGKILSSLSFNEYMSDNNKDDIKDLVSFLFAHGQNEIAADFCNMLASNHQQYFLRDIYEANKKK